MTGDDMATGAAINPIAARKDAHLAIGLCPELASSDATTGFEALRFEHCALPEIDMDEIDLGTGFLGRRLKAPFMISSITGGTDKAADVNTNLAIAAQQLGIAFAVGSQRIALEGQGTGGLDLSLREFAPDVPILANIGGAQLAAGYGLTEAWRAVEMIDADALIVHLNPLQEAVQPEGDRIWRGVLDGIAMLAKKLPCPVVVKEVGAGICGSVARKLVGVGVQLIDVAGAGGTSWAAAEAGRLEDPSLRETALLFADWGVPTARAILDVRLNCPAVQLIGSGGIRSGIDAGMAIRLGADIVGQAAAPGLCATDSSEAVIAHFEKLIRELRLTCFLTGSKNLAELRRAALL